MPPRTASLGALDYTAGERQTLDERERDMALLKELLDIGRAEFYTAGLTDREVEAFESMQDGLTEGRWRTLTPAQRQWVEGTAQRIGVRVEESKPVPRGREVATPAVLTRLPLAPPGRAPKPIVCGCGDAYCTDPKHKQHWTEGEMAREKVTPVYEREQPCRCGGKGLGYGGFHYPLAPGCLLSKQRPVLNFEQRYERAPDGHIDNCALANGAAESDCQVCEGDVGCPDRHRYPLG